MYYHHVSWFLHMRLYNLIIFLLGFVLLWSYLFSLSNLHHPLNFESMQFAFSKITSYSSSPLEFALGVRADFGPVLLSSPGISET